MSPPPTRAETAVVATAGHVDHGKSTLVRALTGTDPDRWAEERRRGLTLDLGFASCVLPSGRELSLVDVPGHERYVGNALAGLGSVRAVLFCVAADKGWQQQTSEHAEALLALGISRVVLAVTRSDLAAPERVAEVVADAERRLAAVAHLESVITPDLMAVRAALDRCCADLPPPDPADRVRLWLDRSFSVRGRGRVVTATLEAGSVRVGDVLEGHPASRAAGETADRDPVEVQVRGLQVHGVGVDVVSGAQRVALAIRTSVDLGRGAALVTPDGWHRTHVVDVSLDTSLPARPGQLVLHVGTAAHAVQVRPLGPDHARLTLPTPLPLQVGDRVALRDPGAHRVLSGAVVLDVAPAPLRRRGAATLRAAQLVATSPLLLAVSGGPLLSTELVRRGLDLSSVRDAELAAADRPHDGDEPVAVQGWVLRLRQLHALSVQLPQALEGLAATSSGMPLQVAAQRLAIHADLLPTIAARAGLTILAGSLVNPRQDLGPGEPAVQALERRLAGSSWDVPDRGEQRTLGLDARLLAAAAQHGRLLRIGTDVVVLPDAPDRAVSTLASLPQPFTVGEAARALGTTRRIVVPLLEHLDALGLTRREGAVRQTTGGPSAGGSTTTTSGRER